MPEPIPDTPENIRAGIADNTAQERKGLGLSKGPPAIGFDAISPGAEKGQMNRGWAMRRKLDRWLAAALLLIAVSVGAVVATPALSADAKAVEPWDPYCGEKFLTVRLLGGVIATYPKSEIEGVLRPPELPFRVNLKFRPKSSNEVLWVGIDPRAWRFVVECLN